MIQQSAQKQSRQLDSAWIWSIQLWLGFGLLFIAWVLFAMYMFPTQKLNELAGDTSTANFFERALLQKVLRYDVEWYVGIARDGYGHRIGDTGFHPLLPLMMSITGRILGGRTSAYIVAGMLITYSATLLLLVLLYRLICLDSDERSARYATLLMMSNPLAWVLFIPYTEPLLMLWSVAAFYAVRKGYWWRAGLAGAAAVLTKQPGIFLIIPLLWQLWSQRQRMQLGQIVKALCGIGLIPLGLLIWLVYRATLGDMPLHWNQPFEVLHALIISPQVSKQWEVGFGWPWITFQNAFHQYQIEVSWFLIFNTVMATIMLCLALIALPRLQSNAQLYTITLLLATFTIIQTLQPFASIERRFLIIFPIFIGLGRVLHNQKYLVLIAGAVGGFLWLVLSLMFMHKAFLP